MYKLRTGWEKDHERWEEVDADERCDDCGEINRNCRCSETADEEPVEKSFQEKHGFDERDGPPEEKECGCTDDQDVPMDDRQWYR